MDGSMLFQCFGAKLQIINNFYIIQSSHNFGSQSALYLCDQHIIVQADSKKVWAKFIQDWRFIKPEPEAVLQHTLQYIYNIYSFTLHKLCYSGHNM